MKHLGFQTMVKATEIFSAVSKNTVTPLLDKARGELPPPPAKKAAPAPVREVEPAASRDREPSESRPATADRSEPSDALKEMAKQTADNRQSVRNAALNAITETYFQEGEKFY
jgi:hypothetical protein